MAPMASLFRDIKLIDSSFRDIESGVYIGMIKVATSLTPEHTARVAVAALSVAAFVATLRGVGGVYNDNRHSNNRGLVLNETAKLRECPLAHAVSLARPEPSALPDAAQVLKSDSALAVCSLVNDTPADNVVGIFLKSALTARKSLELAAHILWPLVLSLALCGLALKLLLLSQVVLARCLDFCTVKMLAIAVRSKMHRAHINTDEIGCRSWRILRQVNRYEQEPLAIFAENQIRLTLSQRKAFALVRAHHERDNHAALQRQDANPVNAFETHQPLVERNRSVLAKLRADILVSLVGFAHLSDAAHGHLSREVESLSQVRVVELLQIDLVGGAFCKRLARKPVRRFAERLKRGFHFRGLLAVGEQLNLQRQFHCSDYRRNRSLAQALSG